MGEWRQYRLAETGRIITGKTPPTSNTEFYGAEIPFVTPTDMDGRRTIGSTARHLSKLGVEKVRSSYITDPAIVVSCIGSDMGKAALLNGPFVSNQQINSVLVCDKFDRLFVYYNLSARKDEIRDKACGAAQPIMNKTEFGNLILHAPSFPLQRSISAVLGALDDKIELNRRMNETLETMARAIFKDWFVDFGPVRAKAEGRPPYLAPEIWSLFPDALDDEDKPYGWFFGRLDDLFLLQRGFDLPTAKRTPGLYPVIAASGPNGTHSEFMIRGPGVTTGRSGVLGNVFFIQEDFWPLNTSLWVKEYKRSSPVHAYFVLQQIDLASYNAGSAVPTLNRNHVHGLPLVVPPERVLSFFERLVTPLFKRKKANEIESHALAQTRDLLLPKLMSGEIRLRDAEKVVEAAA